jgi:hypothetical protein
MFDLGANSHPSLHSDQKSNFMAASIQRKITRIASTKQSHMTMQQSMKRVMNRRATKQTNILLRNTEMPDYDTGKLTLVFANQEGMVDFESEHK